MWGTSTRVDHAQHEVLVTAATEHGATGEVARAIGGVLSGRGLDVAVIPIDDVDCVDHYDAVVLGSAVYAGHWLKSAREFVERASTVLAVRPVWLFSSGPVGDPARKLVQKMGEDPVDVAAIREATGARDHHMFAGKLDRQDLSRTERAVLTVFRGLEGDFRDWAEVEHWASRIADSLATQP